MLKKVIKDGLIAAGLSLFLLISSQTVKAEQDLRLLGYWAFDEGEGEVVKDSSHCENTGKMVDCTWKKGIKGSCLELYGDSYIVTGCGSPEDEFTAEGWFNTYEKKGKDLSQWIIAASDGSMKEGFNLYISGKNLLALVAKGNKGWKEYFSVGTPVSLNTWHYFALTFKSNEYMRLYLDGELKKEIKEVGEYIPFIPFRIYANFGYWRTTRGEDGKYRYFHGFCGMLDEIKIYDEALSSEEILKHYNKIRK